MDDRVTWPNLDLNLTVEEDLAVKMEVGWAQPRGVHVTEPLLNYSGLVSRKTRAHESSSVYTNDCSDSSVDLEHEAAESQIVVYLEREVFGIEKPTAS